ncbi:MAG: hypothetical protein P8O84_05840 [Synechococcus sp. cluster3_bin.96]|nr:hypothetical protein [Synechococcus sp. cluster3_bin.96]
MAAENGFQLKPDNALRMLMWELREADLEGGESPSRSILNGIGYKELSVDDL